MYVNELLVLPSQAFLCFIVISYFLIFICRKSAEIPLENNLKLYLVFLVLIIVPPLLVVRTFQDWRSGFSIFSRHSFWVLLNPARYSLITRIFFVFKSMFFLLAGLIVPVGAIINYFYGYRSFMLVLRNKKQIDIAGDVKLKEIESILVSCLIKARIKRYYNIYIMNNYEFEKYGFSLACIVKKGKNIILILSETLVNKFKRNELDTNDIETIISHEISHVMHRDYQFPIWAVRIAKSKLFVLSYVSYIIAALSTWVFDSLYNHGEIAWSKSDIHNVALVIFVYLFSFRLIETIIKKLYANTMCDREYLADARTAFLFLNYEIVAKSLKRYSVSIQRRKKTYSRRIMNVIANRFSWYPTIDDRIASLKELNGRTISNGKSIYLYRGSMLNTISLVYFFFIALMYFMIWLFNMKVHGKIVDTTLENAVYNVSIALTFLNIMPFCFVNDGVFKIFKKPIMKTLDGYKYWKRMLLNNLIISFVLSFFIGIPLKITSIVFFYVISFVANYLRLTIISILLLMITYMLKVVPSAEEWLVAFKMYKRRKRNEERKRKNK